MTAADVWARIDRQIEAEGRTAAEFDYEAWLDELDRQLTLAEECARDDYEAREMERAD